MTTISRSEEPEQALVPRLVLGHGENVWHWCMALPQFREGAIVTLETLCGGWVWGSLTLHNVAHMREMYPHIAVCAECQQHLDTPL